MKNSTSSKLPQLLPLNLFVKFLIERKYLMNTLIFLRLKYLQMNKQIFKQINLQVMMALKQNFINALQMNQLLSFQMFMTPGESLTPWVLLVEQESYLSYIKCDKKDIANYRLISLLNLTIKFILLILKNQMQKIRPSNYNR